MDGVKMKMVSILFLFGLTFSVVAEEVKDAVNELRAIPSWGGLGPQNINQQGDEIIQSLSKIAALPNGEVRKVITEALAAVEQNGVAAKQRCALIDGLYVFNRLYYDIPPLLKQRDLKIFGAAYVPIGENRLASWPLKFSESGKPTLQDSYLLYCGPPYDVLAEFDYFATQFKIRTCK